MHELGIIFNIIKSVEEVAKENKITHVNKVVLQIGEVSAVVNAYLDDCWKWACSKHELMNNCQLVIETIKAVSICEDCNNTYSTLDNGKTCPICGSEHTHLVTGSEINIKEIEVV
ncbi:MAG: hydrogenase maturation nickel metallochaperone HypA [Bacilli bacterium]